MRLWQFSRILLAVVAGLALAAAVVPAIVPTFGTCRIHANETAAVATLRNISSAQAQFQATGLADRDGDGVGEFGSFLEMSTAVPVRGDSAIGPIDPPVLSGAFQSPDEFGVVTRSGYRFAILLPKRDAYFLVADRRAWSDIDPDRAERRWFAFAWPKECGEGDRRTFFVDESGDVFATDSPAYEGDFPIDTLPVLPVTADGEGADGNRWVHVN